MSELDKAQSRRAAAFDQYGAHLREEAKAFAVYFNTLIDGGMERGEALALTEQKLGEVHEDRRDRDD